MRTNRRAPIVIGPINRDKGVKAERTSTSIRFVVLSALFVLVAAAAYNPDSSASSVAPKAKSLLRPASVARAAKSPAVQRNEAADASTVDIAQAGIERRGHTATALGDGTIFIVGGENLQGQVSRVEILDPASKKSSEAGRLQTPRTDHSATLLPDGRVLIAGGRSGGRLVANTEIYDPSTGSLYAGPALNLARAGHTATLLIDGSVLIIGGDSGGTAEISDPVASSFALLDSKLQAPRSFHSAAVLHGGRILIAGGTGSEGEGLRSAEIFDLATLTFSPVGRSMGGARQRPTLNVLPDGKVQVIGGDADHSMEMFNAEGGYFTAYVPLPSDPSSISESLRTKSRSALIHTSGDPDGLLVQSATSHDGLGGLLDREDHSVAEAIDGSQAVVVGGVNSKGEYLTAAVVLPSSTATVTTDKTDYTPGETVIITGAGWQRREPIELRLHRNNGTPDTILKAKADKKGKFQNSDYVIQQSDLGVTFLLTATGLKSGYVAQTTFTDGNVRVRTNAAGITFDLTFTRFDSTGCTGNVLESGTENNVGNTAGTQLNKGVGNTESILLTAEAFSNQGGAFINWTAVDTDGTEVDPDLPSTSLTICVPGFSGEGSRLYLANYAACDTPVVTTNPTDQTVCDGATATFTAAATGTPAPTVQWQVSTDGGSTFNNIPGATSTTLTFTASASQNGNKYRAVFTNTCGTATTTAAMLTVNTAPTVTTNPVNQTVCDGSTATFTAAASGSPTPTVQWQVSTDGGMTFNNIPGATSTTLSFTASASQNGHRFRAVFTNVCGTANTTAAILTVNAGPAVTTNPTDQTVCSGSMVSFTAAATGSPAPTVQWQVSTDGGSTFNDIPGATSTTLSFTASASQNGNKYRAVFTNTCGTATTTAAMLTVNTAPTVTTNPVDQTVCDGSTATFTAAASGSPTPTVQWQVSTDGGMTFNNIPGATSTTLSFTASASQNGHRFRAVFTNVCGTANTTAAILTVSAGPAVTTNPTDQTVCSGSMVSFTAAATGSPAPTVQWQVSTDGGSTFNDIPGATSTTLSFTASSSQNGNKYRAVFTNSCGSATTTAAMLTVDSGPSITTNPTNQTVCAGSMATFTAAATGSPAPTVQWQVSTDGGSTFNNIPGATSTTLSFTAAFSQSGHRFRAVFTNTCGTATTTAATLTVNQAPMVAMNPMDATICSGAMATFTSTASGAPAPTVQWQVSTDGGTTFANVPGATSTSLVVTGSASNNGHKFRAVFTNICGTATSTAAMLTVNTGPTVTTNPTDQGLCAGNMITFTAAASGSPTPTVQWQVSTDGGSTFANIPGATSTTLSFTATPSQDGHKFRAVFTNVCGTATTTAAMLMLGVGPAITINPASQVACQGSMASFMAAASGSPAPMVQWQVSTDGGGTFSNIPGATSATLSFTAMLAQNGHLFRAVFTNSCGTATTSAAMLTVNTPPVVTLDPVAQTSVNGSPVTFSADATGIPTPTVQWQVSTDGGLTFADVPGATSKTLTFVPTPAQDGNVYRAVFTNVCGTAITNVSGLLAKLEVFDICIDEFKFSYLKIFQFNSVTGDYRHIDCGKPEILTGTGQVKITITPDDCKIELTDTGPDPKRPDRSVYVLVNPCTFKGDAMVEHVVLGPLCEIHDLDIRVNTCECPEP